MMDDLVKRADEVLKDVTPGPWTVKYDLGDTCLLMGGDCQMCNTAYYPWTPDNDADWHFIAAARELVPAMRDRIEADVARIAELALDALAAHTQADEAYQAQLTAEARVKVLEKELEWLACQPETPAFMVHRARAALEGEK